MDLSLARWPGGSVKRVYYAIASQTANVEGVRFDHLAGYWFSILTILVHLPV
jgi:hypothetical protein